jgi:hypothetical protein
MATAAIEPLVSGLARHVPKHGERVGGAHPLAGLGADASIGIHRNGHRTINQDAQPSMACFRSVPEVVGTTHL